MALAKFYKQPYEEFPISVDFSENMVSDETILSHAISAVDNASADASADVLSTDSNDGAFIASVQVVAGVESLSPYKITFRVVTSEGNKWEKDILMRVKEL
jgi:hypothetical protein